MGAVRRLLTPRLPPITLACDCIFQVGCCSLHEAVAQSVLTVPGLIARSIACVPTGSEAMAPKTLAMRRHRRKGAVRFRTTPCWVLRTLVLVAAMQAMAWGAAITWAPEPRGMEPPGPPRPTEPLFPAEQGPPPLPRPVLPPISPIPEEQGQLPIPHVFVRQITIVGSTVFSAQELAAVAAPYVNSDLTSEDLEALRLALTGLYVNAGYINSGAVLPDQTVTDGVITYQIIEGELSRVVVEGHRWFRESYLRNRLTLDVKTPFRISAVQERLQHLQEDERIARLDAELRPGIQIGQGVLHVRVEERLPVFATLELNNYQSPTVGAEQGLITLAHRNLTGNGDILSITYGRSSGLNPQLDANYTLPLSPRETTLGLRYRRNASSVVQAEFDPLDIESQSEIFTLSLRQPVYRTLRRELALALSAERLQSQTFLLGLPFSFAPGAKNGLATDTAVRLSVEWLDRTPTQVIAARSRFSVGIDALGATINRSDLPDGQFFAWIGQFQWGRRLTAWDLQTLFRLDVQLAADPLLPLEQVGVGGRYSVRGYRENQLVRDNAVIASLESHIPLVRNRRWADFVQVVPFVDVGAGWNRQLPTPAPTALVSVGLGARWGVTFGTVVPVRPQVEVFWGQKLIHVKTEGGDLQDRGIHFQVVLSAFYAADAVDVSRCRR
jgi:hemolysin activation/secretion protein